MRPVTPTPEYRTRVQALASSLAQAQPALAARLARAVQLVATGAVREPAGAPYARVASQSRRAAPYRVSPNTGCTCEDAQYRAPHVDPATLRVRPVRVGPPACKHYLALWLLCRASLVTAPPAPAPSNVIPFPAPPLDPDQPIPYALTPKALALLDGEPQPAA